MLLWPNSSHRASSNSPSKAVVQAAAILRIRGITDIWFQAEIFHLDGLLMAPYCLASPPALFPSAIVNTGEIQWILNLCRVLCVASTLGAIRKFLY